MSELESFKELFRNKIFKIENQISQQMLQVIQDMYYELLKDEFFNQIDENPMCETEEWLDARHYLRRRLILMGIEALLQEQIKVEKD